MTVQSNKKTLIKQAWEKAFRVKNIDFYDNFFEIGGHSLIAAKISSILKKEHKLNIKITDIFNFPTIEQLVKQFDEKKDSKNISTELLRLDRSKLYPLSLSQHRLWFLFKLNPKIVLYSYPVSILVQGHLKVQILRKALNLLMQRHESLRMKVKVIDGQPFQEILSDETEFPFREEYISKDQEKEKLLAENALPFDLEESILCRCLVLHLSKKKWVINFNFHHIIFDDWSLDIFAKELSYFYQSELLNTKNEIPSLPFQYIDFTVWQNQFLSKKDRLVQQLSFWKEELQDTTQIRLPYDYLRPKILNYEGDIFRKTISFDLTEELKKIAHKEGVSLFILLLACFKWAISMFSNSEDVIIGSPITNRPFSWQENVIGYFVNTLVFRTIFSKEDTFSNVLKQVKKNVLKAYENQETPFEKIVDTLKIPRELNRNPLFQVMFSIAYESEMTPFHLKDTEIKKLQPSGNYSKFDISLHAIVKEQTIELNFEYSKELFERSTILGLFQYYFIILKEITENQNLILSNIIKKHIPYKAIEYKQKKSKFFPNFSSLYILDKYKNPLSKNVIGEIYTRNISERGIKSIDAEFIASGICGKYVSDTEIEILGALQRKFKIDNGPTIVLGEIEYALLSHPRVIEAIVKKIKKAEKNILEAYVRLAPNSMLESSALNEFVSEKIDAPINIHKIYFLEQPLKIDKDKILLHESVLKQSSNIIIEKKLEEIWKKVLSINALNYNETFFDLGGNSFLVIQVCDLIYKEMKISVAPVELFQYPTIEKLAFFCAQNSVKSNYHKQAKKRREKLIKSLKLRKK